MRRPCVIQGGFSLLEMSMVLVIMGLIFTALAPPLHGYLQRKQMLDACYEMENIRQALLDFAVVHGRLPWAARHDGKAQEGLRVGGLPWHTLGLSDVRIRHKNYRYEVKSNWADLEKDPAKVGECDIKETVDHLSVNFCSTGNLKAYDDKGKPLYAKAVAIVSVPHSTVTERKVCEPGVTWLSAEEVLGRLVTAGRLY